MASNISMCARLREALPLLEPDTLSPEQRRHLDDCSDCQELAEEHEADERAILAFAAGREEPACLRGFADGVLARLAAEPLAATPAAAPILRPDFAWRPLVALAAGLLITVALVLSSGGGPAEEPTRASGDETAPVDVSPPAPVVGVPQTPLAEVLPPRVERPRQPWATPVQDGRSQARVPMLDMLRNVLPDLLPGQGGGLPPLREGEHELKF